MKYSFKYHVPKYSFTYLLYIAAIMGIFTASLCNFSGLFM